MKTNKKSGIKIKNELAILFVCFVASVALQIYSNIKSEANGTELVQQLPTVLVISLIIYILVLIFRLIFFVLNKLLNRNKNV